MECKFVVGQKVVSLIGEWIYYDPENNFEGRLLNGPRKGEIVTIKAIGINHDIVGQVAIKLKEVFERPEQCYRADAFRALNDRPTKASIEVFNKLLTPSKQKERV